jgi:hypothetical protein
MSTRDELARVIHDSLYPGAYREDRMTWPQGIFVEADAILAAGYSKPRTITTAEELDTLPNGSVVLSDVYISNHGQAISFQRWEDGLWHRGARSSFTDPDNFLPATVLYEPTA